MGSQGMPGYPGPQGLVVCKCITSSRINMKKTPVNIYFCLEIVCNLIFKLMNSALYRGPPEGTDAAVGEAHAGNL